jgi:hypothetical protein
MEAHLISAAIAAVIGAIVGAGAIVGIFDVRSREKAAEAQRSNEIWKTLLFLAMAQNAKLKVSLAAGEVTAEGKKIAAMTVAALDAAFARERPALLKAEPSPGLISEVDHDR